MKNQTLYRGGENKKVKATKAEKGYNAIQALQRNELALPSKKEAAS